MYMCKKKMAVGTGMGKVYGEEYLNIEGYLG